MRPQWVRECPKGCRVSGVWLGSPPTCEPGACEVCGEPCYFQRNMVHAPRSGGKSFVHGAVIHEHYNLTMGMPISGRRHLRDVQKEHGVQDLEADTGAESRRKRTMESAWREEVEQIKSDAGAIASQAPRTAKPRRYKAPEHARGTMPPALRERMDAEKSSIDQALASE